MIEMLAYLFITNVSKFFFLYTVCRDFFAEKLLELLDRKCRFEVFGCEYMSKVNMVNWKIWWIYEQGEYAEYGKYGECGEYMSKVVVMFLLLQNQEHFNFRWAQN